MNIDGEGIFVKGFPLHPYLPVNYYNILYFLGDIHIIEYSDTLERRSQNYLKNLPKRP